MVSACSVRVRGVVQGVGFRPFVFRLARRNTLAGWVLNAGEGVDIHLEGADDSLEAFLVELARTAPPAAVIVDIAVEAVPPEGLDGFVIRESPAATAPTVRISPDLAVCDECLAELFNPDDPRHGYPYINCTNCGPRYSVMLSLPYDRPNTTMRDWPLDDRCSAEYHNPENRRFHAQPVACPRCGPDYFLIAGDDIVEGADAAIGKAAELLCDGRILAVKGIGGYHFACDAGNAEAVETLRARKYRKERPFALMVKDVGVARVLVDLTPEAEALLTSAARPIVLARARAAWPAISPDTDELGVMLPYAPLHHLLFASGAPVVMVMTSANRSSEPMSYEDHEALAALSGIADAFLVGRRPIARRVDDSVVRDGVFGPSILRRARGYSPGVVADLPTDKPILAVGADLKNAMTLVVAGQAIASQHIGDLEHHGARVAFERTIADLLSMYRIDPHEVLLVHDSHPEYASTRIGCELPVATRCAVQHHRAHIASVLAEREAWSRRVVGVSFDGTGYGDDGTIWGGEIFAGSVDSGFVRVAHLRPASLIGGDRAARYPVQAAAGFLAQLEGLPDLSTRPFEFPPAYRQSLALLHRSLRVWPTTSMGRLFDAAAALLGFTRETTFEGQAAMWLEHLVSAADSIEPYAFPFENGLLDFRPLLFGVADDRGRGRDPRAIARAFHLGVAQGICDAVVLLCEEHGADTVVCSGGVFQNQVLSAAVMSMLAAEHVQVWGNQRVPCNDGGISLGQAALAAFNRVDSTAFGGDEA